MALHCVLVDPAVALARGLPDWLVAGDALLLLGPACALARNEHEQLPAFLSRGVTVHVLRDELALHGVEQIDSRVRSTDYAGWVELAIEHAQQLTWD